MRIESWLAVLVPFFFCSCGGDDTGRPRPADGATLWNATDGVPFLRGIDTGSGEVLMDVQVGEGGTEVFSIGTSGDQVWIGRDDGAVVVVGKSSGKIEKTLTVGGPTTDIEHLAVGGGSAYVALGSMVDPSLTRIDARDFQTKARAPVVSIVDWFQGVIYDGESLFVLAGNQFAVRKLDPSTLRTEATTGLGYDPANPDVLSEDNYGTGFITHVGPHLWVVDTDSDRLLCIDKQTMTATVAGDLSDLLEHESYTELTANESDFFLLLDRDGKIVRFDGANGARERTYEPEGGAAAMAVSAEKLYVAPTLRRERILEIDIESGDVTRTFDDSKVDRLVVE